MTPDLWMLVASVALTWALILIAASPATLTNPKWSLGNRSEKFDGSAWADRAKRAAENMKENLPLFAILVLVANVSDQANDMSALGAQIFFGARVAHGASYIAGIPYLRTLFWAVSIVGMGLIASSLF